MSSGLIRFISFGLSKIVDLFILPLRILLLFKSFFRRVEIIFGFETAAFEIIILRDFLGFT